jgi:hypothetical protein
MPFAELLRTASASARSIPPMMAAERLARGLPTEIVEEAAATPQTAAPRLSEVIEAMARMGLLPFQTDDRPQWAEPPQSAIGDAAT